MGESSARENRVNLTFEGKGGSGHSKIPCLTVFFLGVSHYVDCSVFGIQATM
jgi:hypothetical protein